MTGVLSTVRGDVFVTPHARDRMERHGVDDEYVEELIGGVDKWEKNTNRKVGRVECDGVEWELVIQPEEDDRFHHDWDLITVIPAEVDVESAAEALGEVNALNLALYSD